MNRLLNNSKGRSSTQRREMFVREQPVPAEALEVAGIWNGDPELRSAFEKY